MLGRTIIVCAILAAAFASRPGPASGSSGDWLLLKATAGPGGASNVSLSVFGVRTGDGSTPVVSGMGIGNSEVGGTVLLHGKGHGPSRISTTATAGSVELELSPDGPHSEDFGAVWGFLDSYDEGTVLGAVLFFTGVVMENLDIRPPLVDSGTVTVEVLRGTGSTPLFAADPGDSGVAVGVDSLAVGTASSTATVGAGVVGGYAGFEFCIVCVGTTFAPNAERAWTYTTTPGTPVSGKTGRGTNVPFAGPAGTWEWRWAGVGVQGGITTPSGTPVYGAWAPIGDDWPLFDAYIGYDDLLAIPQLP